MNPVPTVITLLATAAMLCAEPRATIKLTNVHSCGRKAKIQEMRIQYSNPQSEVNPTFYPNGQSSMENVKVQDPLYIDKVWLFDSNGSSVYLRDESVDISEAKEREDYYNIEIFYNAYVHDNGNFKDDDCVIS